ncbi:MAG: hypothetical protein AB7L70_19150 [Pyrinomonadaceae bacterium]
MAESKIEQIRRLAEADLATFIRLVHPHRVLGAVHEELLSWWTRQDAKSHQLVLLPRDHGKSAMAAYRVAWAITKNPAIRVLYISSTANLAEKQLKFIKDILTSPIYTRYWPEMVNPDEGKREKWSLSEISVDHPRRKAETVRDPTVFTAGLTTSITGLHCDIAVLDDVVVVENALTQEGRDKVKTQYSLLSSIEGSDAREWVVGTRYHMSDLYSELLSMKIEEFNDDGEITSDYSLYEVYERQLESVGDGTGEYLWPRQQRKDGKWFGFDARIRAIKYAQYLDKTQFRAQYYNDPNDLESAPISPDLFQYYNRGLVQRTPEGVYYNGTKLNVFAAIDFAYTLTKTADFSCVVVVGMDPYNNYYILDVERFKTDKISEYFEKVMTLHGKWSFRKIRAETTAAQKIIVKDLKENYIRKHGLALSVDEFSPSRIQGSKEERIAATLYPRYENRQIWHYKGGYCQILEEELVQQNPAHDDVKDCLTACIQICVPPTLSALSRKSGYEGKYHSRFGGIN